MYVYLYAPKYLKKYARTSLEQTPLTSLKYKLGPTVRTILLNKPSHPGGPAYNHVSRDHE